MTPTKEQIRKLAQLQIDKQSRAHDVRQRYLALHAVNNRGTAENNMAHYARSILGKK